MIIDTVRLDSFEALSHLERRVNHGSPSGFTRVHTTSPKTAPFTGDPTFVLPVVELGRNFRAMDYGEKPCDQVPEGIFVHPDMIPEIMAVAPNSVVRDGPVVAPTASGRTVKVEGSDGWYIKLAYKGLLGRASREMGHKEATSAIEVSQIIAMAAVERKLPSNFYLLREVFARVINVREADGSDYEWGYILREPKPYPDNPNIYALIPGFALFSQDMDNPTDPTILSQIIALQPMPPEEFVFECLLAPLVDAYFQLLLQCGLQLEAHAQNTLFAIDSSFRPIGIVMRDVDSIDKDLELIAIRGLDIDFRSSSFKSLRRSDYNYTIKHSFMYDFKLGKYLMEPIISDACRNYDLDESVLARLVRERAVGYIAQLPTDFFPTNVWYCYGETIPDRTKLKRPYVEKPDPPFR